MLVVILQMVVSGFLLTMIPFQRTQVLLIQLIGTIQKCWVFVFDGRESKADQQALERASHPFQISNQLQNSLSQASFNSEGLLQLVEI